MRFPLYVTCYFSLAAFNVLSLCFSSVQLLSRVQLFVTPWTATLQASLSITNSRILLKLMSIESVMASNHLILCHPLLLPSSIFPSIRVFSSESVLHIRWPKYWSFSLGLTSSVSLQSERKEEEWKLGLLYSFIYSPNIY